MRLATAIRVSGAWWFVPAIFGAQSLILLGGVTRTGYLQADYSQTIEHALYPGGPLLAGVAAIRMHRMRRFHAMAPQKRRGVVLRAYLPLVGGTAVAAVLADMLRIRGVPADARTMAILGLTALALALCGLWGIATAWILPTVLAVPVAVALPFWWIAFTPSYWGGIYRQLGPDVPCCSIDSQISRDYLIGIGALIALIGSGLAMGVSLRRWSVLPRIGACGLVLAALVVGVVASVGLVISRGTPVPRAVLETRTTDLLCQNLVGQRICVWPEQRSMARALVPEIQSMNERLGAWGMPLVDGVDQKQPTSTEVAVQMWTADFGSTNDLLLSLVVGYVAREAGCADGLRGDRAADERVAALALSLGWTPGPYDLSPEPIAAARAVLAEDPGGFKDWFYADIDRVGCA